MLGIKYCGLTCSLRYFAELHQQRQVHPHLTQQLLWEEYRQANPDGYRYSRFCELYQALAPEAGCGAAPGTHAGEKLFVDWAGTTIPIYDPVGGPVQQAHLFVAVLGASSYTYAEATGDEQLANWIGAHVRAFEFYQERSEAGGARQHQDRRDESLPLRS